ncbi:MAG: GNAT family N-acetyltransferase [Clostridiales bacterium]|nr:GNAT family N-acetyltransferase [Clostridiales bacterium]
MILLLIRFFAAVIAAWVVGKLVAKLKLPAILGWLLGGMLLGPHALSLLNQAILDSVWYQSFVHVLECAVGLMIGTELVWKKIKKSGRAIVVTTLTQSLGTFLLVSLVFGLVFYFLHLPLYLAFLFGGIALATAPAPALSIVREFQTHGPVTAALIPMAALDDIVGCIVFFTVVALVAGMLSAGALPAYLIALIVLLPLVIGVLTGLLSGFLLKKERSAPVTLLLLLLTILFASGVGFLCNALLPRPMLNFMLIGMAFSATFSNMVSEERLDQIMRSFRPVLGFALIVVILNLGAPLDYHLILGAGLFTVVYIVSRALGKYCGAFFGAAITRSPKTVRNYLGLTLLPHSGVSLVFTGIAVSVLSGPAPESAKIIQGTIAAAAVINEIIAVIVAKKGFEWAGECQKKEDLGDGIRYRPMEPKDYAAVCALLNQSFGLSRYVTAPQVLQCFQKQYLYSCLSEATDTCVAEQNGKIIGVIMGNAKRDYQLVLHLKALACTAWYACAMRVHGRRNREGLDSYRDLHQIYHAFSKNHKGEFDGVLTLFAVDEDYRGRGVGKALFIRLMDDLQHYGAHAIYLYTDSTCNYGFYEHQGFHRLEQQLLTLKRDGKPFQMAVYLYGYEW